jgi:transposase
MGVFMKRRDKAKDLERRRLRGGRWLLKGVPQAEVARRLKVSRPTVLVWNERLRAGGLAALKNRPRGRPAGLDLKQKAELAKALKAGALAEGYATELWTLPRVGQLIRRRFGLSYSDSQVSRILAAMDWSCQRPSRRALQQDPRAVREWKAKRWPALKKTAPARDVRSSS